MGWELDNHWPVDLDQCVMIAAPHTSNWDALYARLALKALGVNVRLTIKDSYMKLPFGPFVRAMGGIGIDRTPKNAGEPRLSMVQVMTDLFKHHPKLVMLVTIPGKIIPSFTSFMERILGSNSSTCTLVRGSRAGFSSSCKMSVSVSIPTVSVL